MLCGGMIENNLVATDSERTIAHTIFLRDRLMADHLALNQRVVVRVHVPQPKTKNARVAERYTR